MRGAEEEAAALFRSSHEGGFEGTDFSYLDPTDLSLAELISQTEPLISRQGPGGLSPADRLAQLMSVIAMALDITALGISGGGVVLQAALASLGIALPLPGGEEAVGWLAGAAFYNAIFNPIENA